MFKKLLITGLALSACLPAAYAQTENYFGGNIAFLDYSEEGIDDTASLTAIVGRLGTTLTENFSVEVRAGVGIGDDTVDISGSDVDVELDTMFGAYARGGIPASESFFPYAIVGFTRGELTASVSGSGSDSESESDVSFGLGADVSLSQNLILNVEYMNYLDKDGSEIDGFSIGMASTF